MSGHDISITASDKGKFSGYLNLPGSAKAPGVVIIQEIFGVNDQIREVVDEYAAAGYVALAPDVFWRIEPNVRLGYSSEDVQKARGFRPKFNLDLGVRDIESTVKTMRAMPECNGKIAAVGYCFGGLMAYLTAARTDVSALMLLWRRHRHVHRRGEGGEVPDPVSLRREGRRDTFRGLGQSPRRISRSQGCGSFVYDGAEHGFNCSKRASFNPEASKLAGSRTLDLLRRTIG